MVGERLNPRELKKLAKDPAKCPRCGNEELYKERTYGNAKGLEILIVTCSMDGNCDAQWLERYQLQAVDNLPKDDENGPQPV